jgi:hypothetical protein
VITLGDILDRAAQAHPEDESFQRCLFLILEQGIDPRTTDESPKITRQGVFFGKLQIDHGNEEPFAFVSAG